MKKMKVLIVDDEDGIRFGMGAFLESSGYSVVEADSCRQARQVFETSPPDAAVIDFRLEDGTAIELLRSFRQIDPNVPLIVMTAYGSVDRAMYVIREGAVRFLTKPIRMPALLALLERLLQDRHVQHVRCE